MININTPSGTKEPVTREDKVIAEFTEKNLRAFAEQKTAAKPSVETVDGKKCEIKWRFFINHFFFVERGKWLHEDNHPEFMSLVNRRSGKDDELISANINFPDKWRVLSVDTKMWGENWNEDVENTEEAVLASMIAYLFAQGFIVADVERDEDDEDLDADEFEQIG